MSDKCPGCNCIYKKCLSKPNETAKKIFERIEEKFIKCNCKMEIVTKADIEAIREKEFKVE